MTAPDSPALRAEWELRCSHCERRHDHTRLQQLCEDCGRPLVARFSLNRQFGDHLRRQLDRQTRSMWRYAPVLPVDDPIRAVTLGEGTTPLLASSRLAEALGVEALWVKDESQNPSGSFKARGMSTAITRARELGVTRICLPSAGNAAGAAAAYAALAGLTARVYMPADSGEAFFRECRAYGAEVHAVEGTIADCGKAMREMCDPAEWFDLSTLKEPFRLEGKKTMGYELFEDSGGALPDVIVYPTGGGTGLIGMWKAFDEMQQMGWIGDTRPRMLSVQAEGCAPIVRAFETGSEFATPFANPHTGALGLRVPSAVGDFLILRAIRESKGEAIAVREDDWADGQRLLGRMLGLFASPEGGAAIAGLRKAVEQGIVSPDERVVVFNTGSGYKYPSSAWPR